LLPVIPGNRDGNELNRSIMACSLQTVCMTQDSNGVYTGTAPDGTSLVVVQSGGQWWMGSGGTALPADNSNACPNLTWTNFPLRCGNTTITVAISSCCSSSSSSSKSSSSISQSSTSSSNDLCATINPIGSQPQQCCCVIDNGDGTYTPVCTVINATIVAMSGTCGDIWNVGDTVQLQWDTSGGNFQWDTDSIYKVCSEDPNTEGFELSCNGTAGWTWLTPLGGQGDIVVPGPPDGGCPPGGCIVNSGVTVDTTTGGLCGSISMDCTVTWEFTCGDVGSSSSSGSSCPCVLLTFDGTNWSGGEFTLTLSGGIYTLTSSGGSYTSDTLSFVNVMTNCGLADVTLATHTPDDCCGSSSSS